MRVRTDALRIAPSASRAMPTVAGSWASTPPSATSGSTPDVLEPRPRRVPLPAVACAGITWAAPSGTPLSGLFAPRALPLADMPDVMRRLLMASLAALMSIMGHGRHVQTAVPVTHFQPQKNHL